MPMVTIHEINDETIELLVDGEHIADANHDEDGWAGMEKMESIAQMLALKLGADFERTD